MLLRVSGNIDTVKAFMCHNADSFAMICLNYVLTHGSSCHSAVLHDINKEIVVLIVI